MRRAARTWPIAFSVEGLNIERFIRQAGEQGIRLTGMRRNSPKRLTALIQETQVPILQALALQGGWKVTIGRRRGAGVVMEWLKLHWLFCAALVAGMTALTAASKIMWRIEIIDGGSYEAEIRMALTELGVHPPMLRRNVEIGQLRDALEWRYPRIAWFECGWRGTTLVIRPEEGVLPRKDTNYNGACDIVASRDGIVHTIVTVAGTPVVEPGDIVRAGELLIKGEERTSDGAVRAVAARGSVMGRVWEGAAVRMPAVEVVTAYTGEQETVTTIKTPWFNLWPMKEPSFERYDTAVSETKICGIFIPVVLHTETRMEATYTATRRPQAEIEAEAYNAAQRKLYEKIGGEESLIDIWGNCSMIDNENVLSVAIGEMRVEIGRQQASTGMAAPEQEKPE